MADKYISIDTASILAKLKKHTNFPYQRAKARRIKDRRNYDLMKDIKKQQKGLSKDRFNAFLDKTYKNHDWNRISFKTWNPAKPVWNCIMGGFKAGSAKKTPLHRQLWFFSAYFARPQICDQWQVYKNQADWPASCHMGILPESLFIGYARTARTYKV